MPIPTTCPVCEKKINVPDSAAGKKVRCSSCQTVFVTDAAVVEPEPTAVTASPPVAGSKPKSMPLPPKTKSNASDRRNPVRKPQSSGTALRLIVLLGLLAAGLFSLACVGVGAFWFLRAGDSNHVVNADKKANINDGQAINDDGNDLVLPPVPRVEILAPKLDEEKVTRELPGNLNDIVVGGGGRFILMNLPQVRKIAMFDANEAKITHYFPVAGDNVKIAASMDKLVMVFPDTKIVQRWSLITKEKELTTTVGDVQNITQVAMGSASNGPLLVGGDRFDGSHLFLDIRTMKEFKLNHDGNDRRMEFGNVRASADGTVFGLQAFHDMHVMVLQGRILKRYHHHNGVGHVCPGPDGKILFTANGLFTHEARPLAAPAPNGNSRFCIPATHGNFYLSVNFGDNRPIGPGERRQPSVNVHVGSEERSLITLNNLDLVPDAFDQFARPDAMPLDKRIICIPDAKLIVTIPPTNNRVVVQRFDVDDAMEKAGIDFLYVTTRPPASTMPGRNYNYVIGVKSKKGGLKYKLDAGPAGMQLVDGKVTWKVPADFAEGEQNVIVTISDKAGQEIFHTFKITVGNPIARNDRPPFGEEPRGGLPPFMIPQFPIDEKRPPAVAKTGQMPPLPAPLPIKPAPIDAETTLKLPDPISNVILAGGGRFLILHLPKNRQVAIFDVNEAKVVKYLPVAADNVMIAAGMTKLVFAFPDTKIVQRWNLLTHERELTSTLPINDAIAGIGMGYGTDGPLLVQTVREPISGDIHFVDIKTMKEIDVAKQIAGHVHRGGNAQMRGSANGHAIGITSGGAHPHGITFEQGVAMIRGSEHSAVIPSADGKHYFGNGIFTSDMKRLTSSPPGHFYCVPALQGQFYLTIPSGMIHPGLPNEQKNRNVELRILGDNRPLLTVTGVEGAMRDVFSRDRETLSIDQRYHFIPDAQLLVTIPTNADRLVLRKLNVDEALEKSGIDFLFVASAPVPQATPGKEYSYPVAVKSKKGGLKYKVDAGPAGMKVSPTGTVSWKVPADFQEAQVDVIMTISDSSGQEIFHTFKIAIAEAAKGKGDAK